MAIIRPDQFNPPHKGNSQRASQGLGRFYMSAPGLNQGEIPPLPSNNPADGVMPNLAYDFFASGDFSAPVGPAPALNNSGFAWTTNNRTSIVTQDPELGNVVTSTDPPTVINDGRDWTAFMGDNSMRFRYQAGEPMTERRFSIGQACPELWMSFWLRVPTNFTHPGANHKLMALWMDGYSDNGDGSTLTMEFRTNGSGGANFYINYSVGRNNATGGDIGVTHFIDTPSDRGRWMHLVVRAVAETSEDANDGSFEVWRQWEDEFLMLKTHNITGIRLRKPSEGPQGFAVGYLMGWSNNPYPEDTEWLLDGFKLSTTSLLEN